MSIPWTEKYRPKFINDIQNQDEITSVVAKGVSSRTIPHLLLYGPPGSGKTSMALSICHEIYKSKDNISRNVLELNASDERSIEIVRGRIKTFSQTSTSVGFPFKIVILDEIDTMTSDAQSALRRTIEVFSKSTRFFLMCNYVTNIIQPIISRCTKFRFKPIENDQIKSHIRMICGSEGVEVINDENLEKIAILSKGDMRRAINGAQIVSRVKTNLEDISDIMGCANESHIQNIWDKTKNTAKYTTDDLIQIVTEFNKQGYPMRDFLETMSVIIVQDKKVPQSVRAKLCKLLGQIDMRVSTGSSQEIQVLAFILSSRSFFKK